MKYRETKLGKVAKFLVPSLKMKAVAQASGNEILSAPNSRTLEEELHQVLLDQFGGFTLAEGMISGYWKDDQGRPTYGEHKEYRVAVGEKTEQLKVNLAELCLKLNEECLYLEVGDETHFIMPNEGSR